MSLRIGLIGDPHGRLAPVAEALELFARHGVTRCFCLGDVAGYGNEVQACWDRLQAAACETILGNHELWYVERHRQDEDPLARDFSQLPRVRSLELGGSKLYLVHASPPDSLLDGIRLLDENGEMIPERQADWAVRLQDFMADVLIVGHTHQVFASRLGRPLVINPGSSWFNHSCAILDLPSLQCTFHGLEGKAPLKSWNWGMMAAMPKGEADA